MECWYDLLFECDCEGISQILRVPCAGRVNTISLWKSPTGPWSISVQILDPRLKKRIDWVLQCASAASFDLVIFDDWKIKKFRVFIRITTIREYFEVWWTPDQASVFQPHPEIPRGLLDTSWWNYREIGFGTETKRIVVDPERPWNDIYQEVPIYHCYYLGQYSWYWDNNWHSPVPPAGGFFQQHFPQKLLDMIQATPNHPPFPTSFSVFPGAIVPPGWEPTIIGYLPMDSTADIESQINQLERGIAADQLLAKTEQGKDFKVWIEKQRHLTPEEITDIERTIYALKTRKSLEETRPTTEGGMLVGTWLKENIMVTEEDMKFFWGDHEYKTYLISVAFQQYLDARFKNCLARNYPIK